MLNHVDQIKIKCPTESKMDCSKSRNIKPGRTLHIKKKLWKILRLHRLEEDGWVNKVK